MGAETPFCLFECTQADAARRRRPLDAVSRAAPEMGGAVDVSEDESSARIEVTIPLDATAPHRQRETDSPARVRPVRILVADDEESIRELVKVAKNSKTVFQAGQQRRSEPRLRATIARIHEGVAGKVINLKAQRHNSGDLAHDGSSADWFFFPNRSGDLITVPCDRP